MSETRPAMKMPELLVFGRVLLIGLIAGEVFRLTFFAGSTFARASNGAFPAVALIAPSLAICGTYALARGGFGSAARLARSLRVDLLVCALLGAWADYLVGPWLARIHNVAIHADPMWAPTLLGALLFLMTSALVREYWPRKKHAPQLFFLTDEDIKEPDDDALNVNQQATDFAETVLAAGAHAGIVFAIDGPWGVGKTSFVNLAMKRWDRAKSEVVVLRFEPLRYASDPDLAERLIRDVSAAIQRDLYVPEFPPAASRYARMLKNKAELSFLGFKVSLEPANATVDELLEDIDDVLKHIRRRVIIVIDDLDRMDAKAVNNVLFAARRTFRLSQAAYVLCYDTENLILAKDEGEKAREFLEKFVNVKLSLFVDPLTLQNFLRHGWRAGDARYPSIPADTMSKVESILSELADLLGDESAALYLPLIGDLRKLKRFVNAALMMRVDKTDLARTDFNRRDLVHLMLLHLRYPGTFRTIYGEEAEGRTGRFSLRRTYDSGGSRFENSQGFSEFVSSRTGSERFLLEQLFDANTLGVSDTQSIDEAALYSRACFNTGENRNLEKYLNLLVRFSAPEPRDTFRFYQDAVDRVVREHVAISSILWSESFGLDAGEAAHDEFWRVLVSQSYDFTKEVANDAIDTLVDCIPHYAAIDSTGRALRVRSIYSLIQLLDRAGWGRTEGKRRNNTAENIGEIAQRIFGDGPHAGRGLIDTLASPSRGTLGWSDLMLFRLQCSADRGGQVFNVHRALVLYGDMNAATTGPVNSLAVSGMRVLSQRVFAHFKRTYIEPKRNYLAEVESTSDSAFYGDSEKHLKDAASKSESDVRDLEDRLLASRSFTRTFVIYQLSNREAPNGSGVGCGYYDESGLGDSGGIAVAMNKYMFEVCFNPDVSEDNMLLFADYCLCNFTSGFFSGDNDDGFIPTEKGLAGGLDPSQMKQYWIKHGKRFRESRLTDLNRRVVTFNYAATYKDDLAKAFLILDNMHAAPPSLIDKDEEARS